MQEHAHGRRQLPALPLEPLLQSPQHAGPARPAAGQGSIVAVGAVPYRLRGGDKGGMLLLHLLLWRRAACPAGIARRLRVVGAGVWISVPTPSASSGLLVVKREPSGSASGQTSALLSLCQLSLGWRPPVPLPALAAPLTGRRRRPQRPWGSSSLPPHQHHRVPSSDLLAPALVPAATASPQPSTHKTAPGEAICTPTILQNN